MPDRRANLFNPNQERCRSVTCRHIDGLLAGMQRGLSISATKLAFSAPAGKKEPLQPAEERNGTIC